MNTTIENQLKELAAMQAEELRPELQPYVCETEVFGTSLKHPLIFEVPLLLPGRANRLYEEKTAAVEQAINEENWHRVVWLHERAYRCWALIEYVVGRDEDGVPLSIDHFDQDTRDLIADVWVDSENIEQHMDDWTAMFDVSAGFWLGSEKERAEFDALPDPIPVWRGEIDDGGWSHTTDKKVALFFAKRFGHDDPITEVTIPKDRVFGYLSRRNESEVLVRRSDQE